MTHMALSSLRGISGVAPRMRDLTDLEKLTRIIDEGAKTAPKNYERYEVPDPSLIQLCQYEIKKQIRAAKIAISTDLLSEYIISQFGTPSVNEYFRGIWTGVLLSILVERNLDFSISITGNGKPFNYLFAAANNTGNITMKNIIGDNIFLGAGYGNGCIVIDSENSDIALWKLNGGYGHLFIHSKNMPNLYSKINHGNHFQGGIALQETENDSYLWLKSETEVHKELQMSIVKDTTNPLKRCLLPLVHELRATPVNKWPAIYKKIQEDN